MARNLVKAGFSVMLYNRSQPVVQSLVEECEIYPGQAITTKSPLELAEVNVLFTMVADDQAFQEVVVDGGLLAAMGEHAAKKAAVKENPSSSEGAAAPLHSGVIYPFFLSHPRELRDPLRSLCPPASGEAPRAQACATYGPEPERANVMKITFNFTLACSIETMAEGSALVQKYGIEPKEYVSLLRKRSLTARPIGTTEASSPNAAFSPQAPPFAASA
ncbi:uncharacterized oxidoreductase YfjR-like [Bactrocera neohumeralis]|uniref:uncharacterized oxidoreductase YfjR-like n=1 Tax=Bactrocera neohumeralis TaxID=98809 RepID=UPI0021661788|nr:uncharacterized oxidoreductase YfjR-like [Bactrocera neohumeralis]